jgi:hypothetical protein
MEEEMMREMAKKAAEQGGGGGGMADKIASEVTNTIFGMGFTVGVIAFAAAAYFYLVWDKSRADSPSKGDGQLGLKVVVYSLLLVALGLAVSGLTDVLVFLLSGAKNKLQIKEGLGHLLSGGALFTAVFLLLLPRTNTKEFPKTERFALGYIALLAGIGAFMAFDGLLSGLFSSAPWKTQNAANFGGLIVSGALAFLAVFRFGQVSGWTTPTRMSSMPPGFPPAGGGGGYPPQQGFPQQGGGYPPQGGGYPPQGGGYPPQGGGGYPPAGGGYPPQGGGGGLPPPGGYQPR